MTREATRCYVFGCVHWRAFHDLRTSTLMPRTVDRMFEAIGTTALGIETAMFKVTGTRM